MKAQQIQKQHYNRIIEDYEEHYDDKYSQSYSRIFMYRPLFEGIPLENAFVLDAMCGSGEVTRFLLGKKCMIAGLDISEKAIELYDKKWKGVSYISDIGDTHLPTESLDIVVVLGGLHHVHPDVKKVMREIHRILRPNGFLLCAEPHTSSIYSFLRDIWYKMDDLFADNEKEIDVRRLESDFKGQFQLLKEKYFGSVAYFLILNSLIFRMPKWLKSIMYYPLMASEWILQYTHTRWTTPAVLMQWRKI